MIGNGESFLARDYDAMGRRLIESLRHLLKHVTDVDHEGSGNGFDVDPFVVD